MSVLRYRCMIRINILRSDSIVPPLPGNATYPVICLNITATCKHNLSCPVWYIAKVKFQTQVYSYILH